MKMVLDDMIESGLEYVFLTISRKLKIAVKRLPTIVREAVMMHSDQLM